MRFYLGVLWISFLVSATYAESKGMRGDNSWITEGEDGPVVPPSFHDNTATNVTVREGQMATLPCSINNLGTKKVIWRRRDQFNPLTIARLTYVDDPRIYADNKFSTSQWYLFIKKVRFDDAGSYECQISTRDKKLRRYVHLAVKPRKKKKNRNRKKGRKQTGDLPSDELNPNSPQATDDRIQISGRRYVEKNQELRLVCNATNPANGTTFIHSLDWFFNGQKLSTDPKKKMYIDEQQFYMKQFIHSSLSIKFVTMENAGIYICRTSRDQIKSLRVDVLNAGTVNVKRGTEKDSSSSSSSAKAKSGWEYSERRSGRGNKGSRGHHHLPSLGALSTCLVVSFLATCAARHLSPTHLLSHLVPDDWTM